MTVPNIDLASEHPDWVLADLVRVVDAVDKLPIGITLTIGGGLITGTLMSNRDYFLEYARFWATILGDAPNAGAVVERWEMAAGTATPSPQYVHLRDAVLVSSNRFVPATGGMLWRGKLADVAGFALTRIVPATPATEAVPRVPAPQLRAGQPGS